jgi:rhomboid-like protein
VFCHGDIGHFIFNGIALFSFGIIVELRLGTNRFLQLFFLAALGAVLFHYAAMAYSLYSQVHTIIPNHLAGFEAVNYPPMLGASGAVYGVMVAFAVLYPNETLLFLFIPYPIKAKYLVPIMVGLDIVLGLGSFSGDNVAHFAHIGGAATGLALIGFNPSLHGCPPCAPGSKVPNPRYSNSSSCVCWCLCRPCCCSCFA